jgi:hypothetical protein
VTLLASGLLIYHGPTGGMVPWLSGQLGYSYLPAAHGLASDWALDLVVVEFAKPGVSRNMVMAVLLAVCRMTACSDWILGSVVVKFA